MGHNLEHRVRRGVTVAALLACCALLLWRQHEHYLEGVAPPQCGQERELSGTLLPSTYLSYRSPTVLSTRSWFSTFRAIESAAATFFAVQRTQFGYFGIQETRTWAGIIAERLGVKMTGLVLRSFEGLVIFSIWDTDSNRCRIVAVGEGAYAGSFGGEGTGCQIKLETTWGEDSYSFVTTSTVYSNGVIRLSGYWHDVNEGGEWRFVGTLEVQSEGRTFAEQGLSSFVEQFQVVESTERRTASFGPHFLETSDGKWAPVTTSRFSMTSSENMNFHAFGMVLSKREFSMGVVGNKMLGASTPNGRVLTLSSPPSVFDSSALQSFINARARQALPTGCVGQTSCNVNPVVNALRTIAPPSNATALIIDIFLLAAIAMLVFTLCQCCQLCRVSQANRFSRFNGPQVPFRR
mmetsp:Transcript_29448/g.83924  ORF Transcript_29448/g.83924 Transcript_29448/m.83924 type:complete len:407 (-) Transcript_29448:119-1339(-)